MRKGKLVLLAAALVLAVGAPVSTMAADRAGVGLEWGMGPNILTGNFNMEFENAFALAWKVSDSFTVAVFNGSALWRGENSYTSDAAVDPSGAAQKYTLVQDGDLTLTGIRILHSVPGLDFLTAGIEFGRVNFNSNPGVIKRGDGGVVTGLEFGTPVAMPASAELLGVTGKVSIFKAETKTVTTDINVSGSFRIIKFADTDVFGTQKAVLSEPKAIDAVTGYSNVTALLGVGLWF
jgi:hypothetical protein